MPKQTDIVGTIRVPEEHYGRFWNFMRSMPTAEFAPVTLVLKTNGAGSKRAHGKDSEGTTGRCIVLGALMAKKSMTTSELTAALVAAGKSAKSSGNLLNELKVKSKMIKGSKKGYSITPAGQKFYNTSCPVK